MESINENKANRNLISIAVIAVCIVICVLWFHGCNRTESMPSIVLTKEVKGKLQSVKPEQAPIVENGKNDRNIPKHTKSDVNAQKSNEEFLQSQINELLAENQKLNDAYLNASDSLKIALYNKAIQLQSFTHTWNNDTINATASGIVRGEVQSIGIKYTIKPQKIEVPLAKETYLRVLAGGSFGINKELNQLTWSASVGFQNRKGNIIRATYQKIGNTEFVTAGYEFSILNFKR